MMRCQLKQTPAVPSSECVLCSATSRLPAMWLPVDGFVSLTEVALTDALSSLPLEWLTRDEAEQDPRFQQWIPYVLVRNATGQFAAYPRRGGEARLHGLWSLGIGGHVNPVDADDSLVGGVAWNTALRNGLNRELTEEFPAVVDGRTQFLGLVHESRTEVGRVHLGAVFVHDISTRPEQGGGELAGLRWIPDSELGTEEWPLERFELWSRLSLRLLRQNTLIP